MDKTHGKQAQSLVMLRDLLKTKPITHIININIGNQGTSGDKLRAGIRKELHNVKKEIQIDDIPVFITWVSVLDGSSSHYYYAISQYTDDITAKHTKLFMQALEEKLRGQGNEVGNGWTLTWLVTKPLSYNNPIIDGVFGHVSGTESMEE